MRRHFAWFVISGLVLMPMETRDLHSANSSIISSRQPVVAEVSCAILGINTENKPIVQCVSKPG
jgi:hypothetical protein